MASQIALHAEYGGVVPEVASRNHLRALQPVIENALAKAGDTVYASMRETEGHNAQVVADVANFASMYGGPVVSTCWHPHRYPPIETGFRSGNIAVAAQAGANLLREFSPDIKRLFSRK